LSVLVPFLRLLKAKGVHLWSDGHRVYHRGDETLTAQELSFLAEHRADLVSLLRRVSLASKQAIPVAPREQLLPLSFAQQRLWFLSRMDETDDAYNVPLALRLRGSLDEGALRAALDRLVYRHESLRTTFGMHDGEAFQQISSELQGFALISHDLLGRSNLKQDLAEIMKSEVSATFNLEKGPLARGRLIRIGVDDHVLQLTMHHIVVDGWSWGVLLQELGTLYKAYRSGDTDPLSPLPVQYADYSLWQRRFQSHDVLIDQARYWRDALAGAPMVLEMPKDRSRPSRQDYHGGYVAVQLDETLTANLKALSQRRGTTLFTTVLTGWAIVLARLSGQEDILIGVPSANRNQSELESLIGFFVNTLVLRVNLSGSPSLEELLARVKDTALNAQANQDLPFEQVVDILKPQRSLAHTPVFQVMFAWQNNDEGHLLMPGLTVEAMNSDLPTSKFDLTLNLFESQNSHIMGTVEYATSMFDRETIERWVGHLHRALEQMTLDMQQRVASVPLLSGAERQQLLIERNEPIFDDNQDLCLHQLFEAQVKNNPDAIALRLDDRRLSYGELNLRANKLAHHLRALGVGRDVLVAICMDRSFHMMIGLLAVLKAGGAYLPLDPASPAERLNFMLADSGPLLVLTHEPARTILRSGMAQFASRPQCLDIEADACEWLHQSSENPSCIGTDSTPGALAYVIYTSGSTGPPKGVMIEHRQVVGLFAATRAHFHFDSRDVWTLFHSFAFDFSVWEIWGALAHGGQLVIVPLFTTRTPDAFYALVCDAGVTVLNQTPTAFYQLTASQASSRYAHQLRCVVFGGEALNISALIPWRRDHRNSSTRLINMYGITETTIHVTYLDLDTVVEDCHGGSPIGDRISDLRLYLLDERLEPVITGTAGEIFVGGRGVARGYLNREQLTKERFLQSPFIAGDRLYRTGDLGRYGPDGGLEYLGRNDFQVKIRGFRIELGEIESRLREHPAVREAVVIAREDTPGDQRLIAYWTSKPSAGDVDSQMLRKHLATALPDYMLPAAYIPLSDLPLTGNGKLDRDGLPRSDAIAFPQRDIEVPIGRIEIALAAIWESILGVKDVGRYDNFFDLGGHSLLAIRLLDRMRREGLAGDVRSLFMTKNLAELAAKVANHFEALPKLAPNALIQGSDVITPPMLPLVHLSQMEIDRIVATVPGGASNVQDVYPLTPLQHGFLFHSLEAERGDPYLIWNLMSFRSRSRLEAFADALNEVIARHDILRTAFVWDGLREPVQVVWRRATLLVEELAPHPADGDVIDQLWLRHSPRVQRLSLSRPPLMRLIVANDPLHDRWVGIWLLHHIVDDNTSLKQLLAEIGDRLAGHTRPDIPPFPFRNFVAQTQRTEGRSERETFFRALLGDVRESSAPFGMTDILLDGSDVAEASISLDAALVTRLRRRARALGMSTAPLFHVAWAHVVARTSNLEDVVFGTMLFGRMQAEGSDRALGLFINTLPIWLRTAGVSAQDSAFNAHRTLAELLQHEHASLCETQRLSAVRHPLPLFTTIMNYRHNGLDAPVTVEHRAAWEGIEHLSAGERTNYPIAIFIDDTESGFSINVQARQPIDPTILCNLMGEALSVLIDLLDNSPDQSFAWRDTSLSGSFNVPNCDVSPSLPRMGSSAFEAPIGPIETSIASIWSAVLGRPLISRRDDFFSLGGNSLLAVRVLSQMSSADFQADLRTFMRAGNLAELAAQLSSSTATTMQRAEKASQLLKEHAS
jgi:amino acid adenylation domain-containing protein